MKRSKSFLYLCINLIVLFSSPSYAQRYFGIATSDYSSINSLYLNPANIAGSKEKLVVGLFSFNLGIDNNLGTFTSIGNIGNALNSSDSGGNSLFHNAGHSTFSMIVPSGEIRGPSLLLKINSKQSIAITTRIRVINQLNNFDQELFNTISKPSFVPNTNYSVAAQNFNWTAHLWSELGITYGIVLLDNGSSQLKAGVTLRYLGGIGYLSLKGNNLDVGFTAGSDSFYASHSDLEYSSNIISTRSAIFNGVSSSDLLGNFFGSKQGSGIGGDAGIVLGLLPSGGDIYSGENTKTKNYKLKISASVTDIGSITYKQQYNSTVNVTGNGYITGSGLANNVKNASDFKNYVVSQGFNGDSSSQAAKIYLPTAMLISADYEIYRRFYINATYVNNLASTLNLGNSYYNQVTITPRYDCKVFTIGFPITYSMLANDMKMGFGLRLGGFFIGSDDMLALFSNNQYGFNFYFGGYIPLFKKAPKEDTNE